MIKDIHASGRYVQVVSSNASTYINGYSGLQGVGNMRYNTSNQNMEVFDGNNWVQLNMGYAAVGLNSEAESLLDWARQKRDEEAEWYRLASNSEAVRIALEQSEQARERLELTAILAREYEQTTS
jgi:hypothetical protein